MEMVIWYFATSHLFNKIILKLHMQIASKRMKVDTVQVFI